MSLPSNKLFTPGFRLIADKVGSYIDWRNYLRLGNYLTLADNTADPSAVIDVDTAALSAAIVPVNSGSAAGRVKTPVLIEEAVLSASASHTTSFTAGLYSQIIVDFRGRYNGTFGLQLNADSGTNYSHEACLVIDTIGPLNQNAAKGVNANAIVGYTNAASTKSKVRIEIDIENDGFERVGLATSGSHASAGTAATSAIWNGSFCWHNAVDAVTSVRIAPSTSTMSGIVRTWGIPV